MFSVEKQFILRTIKNTQKEKHFNKFKGVKNSKILTCTPKFKFTTTPLNNFRNFPRPERVKVMKIQVFTYELYT